MNNHHKLYIGGKWVGSDQNDLISIINPCNKEVVSNLCAASEEDIEAALSAAQSAFEKWSKTTAEQRSNFLKKVANIMQGRAEKMARILTIEQGKPIAEATGEVATAIRAFEWAAGEIEKIQSKSYGDGPPGYTQKTEYEPVGVVAAFAPWNFPAMLPARKIAFALAAGCTMIIKPAEEAPGVTLEIAKAIDEADLPAGVLNIVFGDPAMISTKLITSKIVRKVSLTGSTAVGKLLAGMAAENLTPCVLELGGHAPVLVFDDIDVEKTAKALAAFKYRNAGQVCVSPTRFFIHENIADDFLRVFKEYASNIVVGNGLDIDTDMGPLAHERRLAAVDALVKDAVNKGATLLLGGSAVEGDGYFYTPTILTEVPEDASILKTEIFGPVAVISTFSDIDNVISQANGTDYGLASYLFCEDQTKIEYVRRRLEAGLVSINIVTPILENVPFGGVKESGYGYEGGREGLLSFMNLKLVHEA